MTDILVYSEQSDSFPLSAEQIHDALDERWPVESVSGAGQDGRPTNFNVVASPPFTVSHLGSSVCSDGTAEQQAEVAVWLRLLLPPGLSSDLTAYDIDTSRQADWSGHRSSRLLD